MKAVKRAHDFAPYPAANTEDMTQPMGPLEEGDQAIVDAVHRLPEGSEHVVEQEDGTRVRIIKDKGYGQEGALVQTTKPDGSREQLATLIDKVPKAIDEGSGVNGITANISEWPTDSLRGSRVRDAVGNRVGAGNQEHDRPAAQTIKREVARRIDTAREGLGKVGVTAASKSTEQ